MRFTEYLTEHVIMTRVIEEADLPIAKEVQTKVQGYIPFTGTALRKEMSDLVQRATRELKEWAVKVKPYIQQNGYRTQSIDQIIADPEKAAKALIMKYAREADAGHMTLKIGDALKDVSLDLPNQDALPKR